MGKRKSKDTLSLDPSKQDEVLKEVNEVKKKMKKGEILTQEQRKTRKLLAEKNRGLIFISHLPHGFYQNELRDYFKQFGKVTNVKVCRSNKTGKCKGYGYVEFANPEVAKIAAETMNNYLMFKKRLVVEFVPYEKRPKSLFHGQSSSEHRYSTKTRRNKQSLETLSAGDDVHLERTKKRLSRLNKKMKKLHGLGINAQIDADLAKTQNSGFGDDLEVKMPRKKKLEPNNTSSMRPKRISSLNINDVNIVNPTISKKRTNNTGMIKKNKKSKMLSKQNPKLAALNSQAVKKIARELIRKKGKSLLHFPSETTKSSKKGNKL